MSEVFPPVETEGGEAVRQTGLRVLGERYKVLVSRSRMRELSQLERGEVAGVGRTLEVLQSMAPVGQLMPARARERGQLTTGF